MKEKIATFITLSIMAFFAGFLFLHGNQVINGQKANNFKLIAFANGKSSITNDDLSALSAFVDTRRSGTEKVKVEFNINDEMADKLELELAEGINRLQPTEKAISALRENSSGSFNYKIKIIWDKKNSDQIEKQLTINNQN
jgi:hypothetical protein